jgi:hypothetical protein
MRAFLLGSVLLLAAGSVACDNQNLDFVVGPGGPQTIQASAISLSTTAPTLNIGQSVQLTAVVLDASGNPITNPSVKWTSSNTSVATVSATGLVAAVALGTATVTATSGNVSKDATVAVSSTPAPPPPAPTGGSVTLPALLNTDMPAAPSNGGTIISVPANGDLQAAINAAKPGDVIELARGATYSGHFVLPNKGASSSWIVIRPATGAALPPEGQRMTPALAASLALPKVVSSNYESAFRTLPGAHHYRLVGLEVSLASAPAYNYGLILLGGGNCSDERQCTLADIPHDLVLDRMYVHGAEATSLKRCVALNSAATAIIDSYLSECHAEGQDAQAIGGWNGPGPFKIVNNYLEGSAENILYGGADPSVPNLIPSDIEIRRNHVAKPTSWHGGRWLIKNLLELKNAQRVLIEGNVFENNWENGQAGAGIVMWSVNQGGGASWDVMQDITFRKNVIRNVGAGFQITATSDQPSVPTRRMSITDNLVYGINQPGFEGTGRGFQIGGGLASLSDLTIANNTVIGSTTTAITLTGTPTMRLTVTDNVMSGGAYGLIGDGTGAGTASLSAFAPDAAFLRNVIVIPPDYVSQFPIGNSYPSSLAAIGFVDTSSSDYHLAPLSPFKATTGRDPGADIDAVHASISGVVLP